MVELSLSEIRRMIYSDESKMQMFNNGRRWVIRTKWESWNEKYWEPSAQFKKWSGGL
jgi:hypothetical protein